MVGVTICTLVQPQIVRAQAPTELSINAYLTTVRIEGASIGSGVIYDQQGLTYYVLAAQHVFDESGTYEVVTHDGERYPISVQQNTRYPGVDAVSFTFSSENHYETAELGDSNQLLSGSSVYVAGWAEPSEAIKERTYMFTDGAINTLVPNPEDGYSLLYSNDTRRGMSGGPIFDNLGNLVGIHGRSDVDFLEGQLGVLGIPINTILNSSPELSTASQRANSGQNSAESLDALIEAAFAKADERDFTGAVLVLNRAIQQYPDSSRGYSERAWARAGMNHQDSLQYISTINYSRIQQIQNDIDKALELNGNDTSARLLDFKFRNAEYLAHELDVTLELGSKNDFKFKKMLSELEEVGVSELMHQTRYNAYSANAEFSLRQVFATQNAMSLKSFDADYHQETIEEGNKLLGYLSLLPGEDVPFPLSMASEARSLQEIKQYVSGRIHYIESCREVSPFVKRVLEHSDFGYEFMFSDEHEIFVAGLLLLIGYPGVESAVSEVIDASKLEEIRLLTPTDAMNDCGIIFD